MIGIVVSVYASAMTVGPLGLPVAHGFLAYGESICSAGWLIPLSRDGCLFSTLGAQTRAIAAGRLFTG